MEKHEIVEKLHAMGVTQSAVFVPASQAPEDRRNQINWNITIQRNGRTPYALTYSEGIGHLPFYDVNNRSVAYRGAVQHAIETGRHGPIDRTHLWSKKLPEPSLADVMYSLLIDTSDADENFEDWARSLGYDDDSIKALRIYEAVQDEARAMRRMFTSRERDELAKIFEDY